MQKNIVDMLIIGSVAITFALCSMPHKISEDDELMQIPNGDSTSGSFALRRKAVTGTM